MSEPRYPIEPLAAALGIELGRAGRPDADEPTPHGWQALAEALSLTVGQARYRAERGLTWDEADELATLAGFLPWQVWPQWAHDAPDEHDLAARTCTCDQPVPITRRRCDRCGGQLAPTAGLRCAG